MPSKQKILIRSGRFAFALLFSTLQLSCGNIFKDAAGKNTDEANYEEALKALDARTYDNSISYFQLLSPNFLARADVLQNFSGAYAGKCGLEFIPYFTRLSSASTTGSTFFKFLMNQFTQVPINPASCTQAETLIKQIWKSYIPTPTQQLFMAILSMVKIGAYLRNKADNAENGGGGDGSTDAAFNACSNTNDLHHLTDPEVAELVTGLSLFLQNVAGFLGSLSADLQNQLNVAQSACALLSPNPCATTDASNVTGPMISSLRDLLATSPTSPTVPMGIGTCVNLDPTTCCP